MNKKVGLFLGALILSSFLIGVVTAADVSQAFKPVVDMISGLIQSIYEAAKPAVQLVVGDTGGDAGIFFAKFLLLLLMLAMVSAILAASGVSFLSDTKSWTHWVITGATSILGIYFLTPDLIRTILIPNSTLGVVLTAALPFLIYFWFVEKSMSAASGTPGIIRRTAWIAYAVVFLSIWLMNQDKIITPIVTTIYPLVCILAICMALFDGTIQRFFNHLAAERLAQSAISEQIAQHKVNLQKLKNAISTGVYVPGATMITLGYDSASYPGYVFSVAGDSIPAGSLKDMKAIEKIIRSL